MRSALICLLTLLVAPSAFAAAGRLRIKNNTSTGIDFVLQSYIDGNGAEHTPPGGYRWQIGTDKPYDLGGVDKKPIIASRVSYYLEDAKGRRTYWRSNYIENGALLIRIGFWDRPGARERWKGKIYRNESEVKLSRSDDKSTTWELTWPDPKKRITRIVSLIPVLWGGDYVEFEDPNLRTRYRVYNEDAIFARLRDTDWILFANRGAWLRSEYETPPARAYKQKNSYDFIQPGSGVIFAEDGAAIGIVPPPQESGGNNSTTDVLSQAAQQQNDSLQQIFDDVSRVQAEQRRADLEAAEKQRQREAEERRQREEAARKEQERRERQERISKESRHHAQIYSISVDLAGQSKYVPKGNPGPNQVTHCKQFVHDFADRFTGRRIPELYSGKDHSANDIAIALREASKQPQRTGWNSVAVWQMNTNSTFRQIDERLRFTQPGGPGQDRKAFDYYWHVRGGYIFTSAQDAADRGRLVIAAWQNPSGGHGHVAVVVPSRVPSKPMIPSGADHWNTLVPWTAQAGGSSQDERIPEDVADGVWAANSFDYSFSPRRAANLSIYVYDPQHFDDLNHDLFGR